ncbi:MAG: hypothetical protein VYC39_09090 [Myxococcota bacterium]|nr:hypothetical protein [Myxococcota bacterium]
MLESEEEKVVCRFKSGRIERGRGLGLDVGERVYRMVPQSASDAINIPIESLKAIFCVASLQGNSERKKLRAFIEGKTGTAIRVCFRDEEILYGRKLEKIDGLGFWMKVDDPDDNNSSLFVPSSAVRWIEQIDSSGGDAAFLVSSFKNREIIPGAQLQMDVAPLDENPGVDYTLEETEGSEEVVGVAVDTSEGDNADSFALENGGSTAESERMKDDDSLPPLNWGAREESNPGDFADLPPLPGMEPVDAGAASAPISPPSGIQQIPVAHQGSSRPPEAQPNPGYGFDPVASGSSQPIQNHPSQMSGQHPDLGRGVQAGQVNSSPPVANNLSRPPQNQGYPVANSDVRNIRRGPPTSQPPFADRQPVSDPYAATPGGATGQYPSINDPYRGVAPGAPTGQYPSMSGPYGGPTGQYPAMNDPYGHSQDALTGQYPPTDSYGGAPGGATGQYPPVNDPYGRGPGGATGQYPPMNDPYGAPPDPYGGAPGQYPPMNDPYGGGPGGATGQYPPMSDPYGAAPDPYGGAPGQYPPGNDPYGGGPGGATGQYPSMMNEPYGAVPDPYGTSPDGLPGQYPPGNDAYSGAPTGGPAQYPPTNDVYGAAPAAYGGAPIAGQENQLPSPEIASNTPAPEHALMSSSIPPIGSAEVPPEPAALHSGPMDVPTSSVPGAPMPFQEPQSVAQELSDSVFGPGEVVPQLNLASLELGAPLGAEPGADSEHKSEQAADDTEEEGNDSTFISTSTKDWGAMMGGIVPGAEVTVPTSISVPNNPSENEPGLFDDLPMENVDTAIPQKQAPQAVSTEAGTYDVSASAMAVPDIQFNLASEPASESEPAELPISALTAIADDDSAQESSPPDNLPTGEYSLEGQNVIAMPWLGEADSNSNPKDEDKQPELDMDDLLEEPVEMESNVADSEEKIDGALFDFLNDT